MNGCDDVECVSADSVIDDGAMRLNSSCIEYTAAKSAERVCTFVMDSDREDVNASSSEDGGECDSDRVSSAMPVGDVADERRSCAIISSFNLNVSAADVDDGVCSCTLNRCECVLSMMTTLTASMSSSDAALTLCSSSFTSPSLLCKRALYASFTISNLCVDVDGVRRAYAEFNISNKCGVVNSNRGNMLSMSASSVADTDGVDDDDDANEGGVSDVSDAVDVDVANGVTVGAAFDAGDDSSESK